MNGKIIFFIILSFIAGISFIGTGFYFLSKKFLEKINEAAAFDEKKKKHNSFRAKGSGYMSVGIGALTIVFSFFILMMPSMVSVLALVYMIVLMIAFGVLMIVFK